MRWPSFQYVFFDCDSTLSTIEGIDVLAESADKKWRVEVLTNAAMNGDLDLSEVYGKRLKAVRPTREQVHQIKNAYKKTVVEDAADVIAALQHIGVEVFVISGGLLEPVKEFAISLGVKADNVRAVDVQYDSLSGEWWRQSDGRAVRYKTFEEGALTVTDGKADIVQELLKSRPPGRSLLIGDGSSDMMASRRVDLFVGYGGVITREKVLNGAPVFIHCASLAPLLLIALGPMSLAYFNKPPYAQLIQKAQSLGAQEQNLSFNDLDLESKFKTAFQHQAKSNSEIF
ncbi:MAG: HAD-IB family phosphatase [Chloroflexota bacterium]